MNTDTLKNLQQKEIISYFDDGIWDLAFGLIFLSFGFFLQIKLPILVGIAVAAITILVPFLKQAITQPRYGDIQPLRHNKRRFAAVLLIFMAVILFLYIIITVFLSTTPLGSLLEANKVLVFGFILGSAMIFSAYGLRFSRLYFYAILVMIPFVTENWFLEFPAKMMIIGAIITLMGVVLILRFIQRFPKTNLPEA